MTRCNHFPMPTREGGLGQCVLEYGHAGEHQWEVLPKDTSASVDPPQT